MVLTMARSFKETISFFNVLILLNFIILTAMYPSPVSAATISWAGHTWNVTTGGMAGSNTGAAGNIVVDADGYLHLKITQSAGAWTCAEMFSTDNLGFGTYRWQIDGPVDKMDKNVVLGLFPYGPEGGIGADGTNEIDIEYARWGNAAWPNGNYTVYPNSGATKGETTFNFTLTGTYTTSSFVWTSTGIAYMSQEGFKAAGDNTGIIKTWTYAPSNPSVNIPQRAMPLGMNLWLCSGCGNVPSNGQPVDIIIRSFQFIAPGTSVNAIKPHASLGAPAVVSVVNGIVLVRLDRPAIHDRSMQVLDTRGRVVRIAKIPAGENGVSLQNLGAGVHIITVPESGIVKQAIVLQ
jgi:hypothetical protein